MTYLALDKASVHCMPVLNKLTIQGYVSTSPSPQIPVCLRIQTLRIPLD